MKFQEPIDTAIDSNSETYVKIHGARSMELVSHDGKYNYNYNAYLPLGGKFKIEIGIEEGTRKTNYRFQLGDVDLLNRDPHTKKPIIGCIGYPNSTRSDTYEGPYWSEEQFFFDKGFGGKDSLFGNNTLMVAFTIDTFNARSADAGGGEAGVGLKDQQTDRPEFRAGTLEAIEKGRYVYYHIALLPVEEFK